MKRSRTCAAIVRVDEGRARHTQSTLPTQLYHPSGNLFSHHAVMMDGAGVWHCKRVFEDRLHDRLADPSRGGVDSQRVVVQRRAPHQDVPNARRATLSETARLTSGCASSRNPIAVQGVEQMNRSDLVSHVATETSVTKATADRLVEAVFSTIGDALARNEPVAIAGFGKFTARSRAARRGRNPRTGEPLAVAASKVLSFKASTAHRDTVNG